MPHVSKGSSLCPKSLFQAWNSSSVNNAGNIPTIGYIEPHCNLNYHRILIPSHPWITGHRVGINWGSPQATISRSSSTMTNSLIKSTWQFLYHNELTLRHNIHFPQPRERDIEIMTAFFADQLPIDILDHINKCRLCLRAFFLSDIMDGSGKYILQEAWQRNQLNLHKVES